MSGSLTDALTDDLNAEIPVLQLEITTDEVLDPSAVPALQAELTADQTGLTLETDILGLQVDLAAATDPSDIASIQAEIDADQSQLLALDLTLCFAHGTHILTERGEVLIEDLEIGDLVITPGSKQAAMPIRWIGRHAYEGDAARFAQPVLVRAGALGNGLPHRDLRLSRDHCLFLDGRLVPAKLLINGTTILATRGTAAISYANIELDQHAVILAEGVASETYLDCGNRARFDNALEANEWLSSRPARTDAAWTDGTAFALPLWEGPELTALIERLSVVTSQQKAA